MLAEMPGGIFQTRRVSVTTEGLEATRQRRFFDNRENCVFAATKPLPLDSFSDLEHPPTHHVPDYPSKWMVIAEDNGFFPYSTFVINSWCDIEERQNRRLEYQEVGRQRAELHNIRTSLGNPLLTSIAVVCAMTITVMMVIMAWALIGTKLG